MSTVLLLIRHASHDWLGRTLCGRMAGVTLSGQGRAEAQALAERLQNRPLAAVYSSPLERALQTAEPIAAAHGQGLCVEDALSEIDFGRWTGETFDALAGDSDWSRWNAERGGARPPGGESMVQAQARVTRFLRTLRSRHEGQQVAAVSHGDVIKAAVADALGLSLDLIDRFEVSPASVSTIVTGDWGAKVLGVNEVAPCAC